MAEYARIEKWKPPEGMGALRSFLGENTSAPIARNEAGISSVSGKNARIERTDKAKLESIIPERYREGVFLALGKAQENAEELREAIRYFEKDKHKLEAVCFLVQETANRIYLEYPENRWENPPVEHLDARSVTSEYLIQNVELAFEAAKLFPWANDEYKHDKEAFFSGVLPYRVGTGPLDELGSTNVHWRKFLLDRDTYNRLKEEVGLKTTFEEMHKKLAELAERYKHSHSKEEKVLAIKEVIRYIDCDFLHNNEGVRYFSRGPEELSIKRFLTAEANGEHSMRGGRCTDLDNVLRMCLMSIGIPTTSTRIIAWPNGDGNHEILSWTFGKERFDLNAITTETPGKDYLTPFQLGTAKVYEELWGDWGQSSAVTRRVGEEEKLPWHIGFYLGTRSMTDVTDRYTRTASMKLSGLKKNSLVYLGVMNNSSDVPSLGVATVAAQRVSEDRSATFDKLGNTKVLYFAYYYDEVGGVPTASVIGKPFALNAEGKMIQFEEEKAGKDAAIVDFSSQFGRVEPKKEYELVAFGGGGWKPKKSVRSDSEGKLELDGIQLGVLYALKDVSSGSFMRPFSCNLEGKLEFY